MKLHASTVKKIIRLLEDGSEHATRVAEFFFDAGDGPKADLERSAGELDAMAAQLRARLPARRTRRRGVAGTTCDEGIAATLAARPS